MNTEPLFELNIALIPEQTLADKLITASQMLAEQYPAVVQLNDVQARLALAPHLTLYQMPVSYKNLDQLLKVLGTAASSLAVPVLRATGYTYNADEASFELQYETTHSLLTWQQKIIDCSNPLRGDLLLEKDPAGHDVQTLLQAQGVLGENIRRTGYAEVGNPANGGLFRPHVTLNWFNLGTDINIDSVGLPAAKALGGTFPMLGVYLLGPHGTCSQRLVQYPCR